VVINAGTDKVHRCLNSALLASYFINDRTDLISPAKCFLPDVLTVELTNSAEPPFAPFSVLPFARQCAVDEFRYFRSHIWMKPQKA
jgi:hypothetical protein